jgi:SAM-dependent methyltransferase
VNATGLEVSSGTIEATGVRELGSANKDRGQFARVLAAYVRKCKIDVSGHTLIVGGSLEDVKVLRGIGFRRMTLSNIQPVPQSMIPQEYGRDIDTVSADVENMELASDSYDFVIAHDVLHHCRSPHVALGEMLRVSRRHVAILELNDSLCMTTLVKMKFTFPYEVTAVVYHNYESGGVRDSCIPNFAYRWNRNDMFKAVSSFLPEREFDLHVHSYWDFNVDGKDLTRRKQTRLHIFTDVLGPEGFVRTLRSLQPILNRLPLVHGQGNKFFCCIEKKNDLKPWLTREGNTIVFNRKFGNPPEDNHHD